MNRLRQYVYRLDLRPIAMGLALLSLVAWAIIAFPANAQDQEGLIVDRAVTPDSGMIGEIEFDVAITISGVPDMCPGVTLTRPVDIVLVLDRSGSMSDSVGGGDSKLDLLKSATKAFLRQMDLTTDRVAVVQFDDASNVIQSLTNDRDALDAAIDSLRVNGGTSIDSGVLQGYRELQRNSSADASQVIVVFTDGQQNGSAPIARARDARDAGIRVITIGMGRQGDIDPDMLQAMASSPDDAYIITDPSQLADVYQTIAHSVVQQPASATDVILEHQFNATAFELVPGSLHPQTATVNGNRISLPIAQVLEAPVSLTYRVRPLVGGSTQVDMGDRITYNLCGQTARQIDLPAGLPVAVQVPPTDTPTPLPTDTPTTEPTLTPAPTWTPAPPPPPGDVARARVNNLLCDTGWLNWLFGILLLLFFLWLLWRVWKARQDGEIDPDGDRRGCLCKICDWIPWLFVPLTLLLLWSLLSALDLCPVRESLYFWRIGGGQANGQIYITDSQGQRPAEAFDAVNRGNSCIGCHAVSSGTRRIAAIAGGGTGPVVVYDLDGSRIDIPNVSGSYVNWSPDGRLLAVGDEVGNIQIIDVDANQVRPLAGASEAGIFETMPTWSSDGTTIAFVRGARAENSFTIVDGADIFVVPAGGGLATPLPGASGDGFNYYPAYSPDGRWLAFTRHTTGRTTYAAPEAEIFLVPTGGGQRIRLSANDGVNGVPLTDASNSWPTWSLDGSRLAFNSKRNDPSYDLFMTTIDASGNSGAAEPVVGASEQSVFEHLPFWGLRPDADPLGAILGLWPFLLAYLLLGLIYWLCRNKMCMKEAPPIPPTPAAVPPDPLPPMHLAPLWQVAPTLIVGVGGTGRWVLTHLKKSLSDAGFGELPEDVKFALIDTSEREMTNVYRDAAGRQAGVSFAGTSLDKEEVLLLGPNLSSLIGQTNDAALAGWFPHDTYQSVSEQEKDLSQGTNQRRPMARAGLIKKLREGAKAAAPPHDVARLWQYLVENSRAVVQKRDGNNDLARIVLVGSLAGGMSGVLGDLAVLLRAAANKALPDGGTVNLEGYFATDGPFRQLDGSAPTRRSNTAATARELQRLQMAAGQPTIIDFTAGDEPLGEGEAHLRQRQTAKPFDEIVLFGRGNYPNLTEPWATTMASMADVLALRLDRGTAAGTNQDPRANVRGQVQNQQNARGQAIVASAGSYTYRLPLVDILQVVHTRWARKLYHVFLMGDQDAAMLSFDPKEAGLDDTPEARAQKFVEGRWENAPAGMMAAGGLALGYSKTSPHALSLLAGHTGNEAYRTYLNDATGLILNGARGGGGLPRRAPRIGYATQFTAEVHRLLALAAERAQENARSAPDGGDSSGLLDRIRDFFDMGSPSATTWSDAAERLTAWRDLTERSHRSLQDVRRLMSDDQKNDRGETVVPGLYAELNRRQADAEARRAQMDQVVVRRYLWSRPANPDRDPADKQNQQDLTEEWTQDALEAINEYLNRFHWQTLHDGSVRLSLITYEGARSIRLDDRDPETVRQLADELIKLAAAVTQDRANKVRLADVLPTQLSSKVNHPEAVLAEEAWRLAAPSIASGTRPGQAIPDREPGAIVGIPDNVQNDQALSVLRNTFKRLTNYLSNTKDPVNATVTPSTDSTAMTLVRSFDLMPLFGLPEIQESWQTYARNAGNDPATGEPKSTLTPVYRAEATALQYERRLEDQGVLNQAFRQLNPLLVSAMQRPEIVQAFALGVAAGWINAVGRDVTLTLPGSPAVSLPPAPGENHPLIAALLRAVAEWDAATPEWQQLRAALDHPSTETQQAWHEFIDAVRGVAPPAPAPAAELRCENGHPMQPGQKFCGICGSRPKASPAPTPMRRERPFAGEPAIVSQDLVAIATLEVYRRERNSAGWDGLVMTKPR